MTNYLSRIFNEGADARLSGQPKSDNPYEQRIYDSEYIYWRRGWEEVHWHYAELRPWLRNRLPEVMEISLDRT